MKFKPLKIPEVVLISPQVYEDNRGFFFESFRQSEFKKYCGDFHFVQDNHSKSEQGVLRGLHYQLKHPQGKLVRVTRGKVFDVAVDIRKESDTYAQWVGVELNESSKQILWIPPGFAHGFYVLSKEAEFQYKCTDYYNPTDQYSIIWNDPIINIEWPIQAGTQPTLSEKDLRSPFLNQ